MGRITYPECDAPARSNESFRSQSNMEHHTGLSPFCSLAKNMVKCFLIDYMHKVCLGVMKRLLICWTGGCKKAKLSFSQKLAVNARIQAFRYVTTSDFNRKLRTLETILHWKATEFRTFLLYTGYFVLHEILMMTFCFLYLIVAMRILLSEKLAADKEYSYLCS